MEKPEEMKMYAALSKMLSLESRVKTAGHVHKGGLDVHNGHQGLRQAEHKRA